MVLAGHPASTDGRRGAWKAAAPAALLALICTLTALSASAGAVAADSPIRPYASQVLERGSLVSYWRLGESGGSVAADAKNGRDGTYAGGLTLGQTGALTGSGNTSASFTGGRVKLPAMPTSGDFTVEGWMQLHPTAPKNNTLYGGFGSLRLLPRPDGYYAGIYLNGTEYKLQGAGASNVGEWVHWALVRAGSRMTLYRNGAPVAERTDLPAAAVAKLDGEIGSMGSSYPADAKIDEVAVYSGALSAAEVESDFVSGTQGSSEHEPPTEEPPGADTYVDGASLGGQCNDARTAAEAASPATPWCSVGRAAQLAGAGATVLVRAATYPATVITAQARLEPTTFKAFESEAPVLDGLTISGSSGLRFIGFRITDQTVLDNVARVELSDNDISPHGVAVPSGRDLLFEGNRIHDLTMDINPASGSCIPPRCGYGFRINQGQGLTFKDNLFSGIPGDGIQSGTAENYLIEGNEFERISAFVDPAEHSDSIQFYRGSDGVRIRGNYFHDTRGPLLLGTGADEAQRNLVVENNTIVAQRDWALKAFDAPGMVLANNTVWDARDGVVIGDTSSVSADTTNVRAFNNIIDTFTAQPQFFALEDYNLVGTGQRAGSHDLATPPRFADRTRLDYSLMGSSPGIDAGLSTGAPTADSVGQARVDVPGIPNTGGGAEPYFDLGSHEFNGTYEPPGGSYSQTVLDTPGLLSYWRLGEFGGSVAADAKGGRHGTYVGGMALGQAGALTGDADTAVSFSGGRVKLPAMPSSGDFTVEGWMQLRPTAAKNNTLYGGFGSLRLLPRRDGYYAGIYLNGKEYLLQGAGASNVGAWVHWALVRAGSRMTLYRNGAPVAQRTNLPASAVAKLDGEIGRMRSSYPADAKIDEVAVYSGALSAAQVAAHYDLGS